jgi:NAD(P)-dependent dehydrogenase (short-subunit alcohol dehydrogenase family)
MSTLAVVGAGPGLGMAIARRFGGHGHSVALLARNRDKLDTYVGELEGLGVTAAAFPADVTDRPALADALRRAEETLGPIDVLEYSPTPGPSSIAPPLEMTAENTQPQLEIALHGAIAAVQAVLPGMRERGSGALLFTTGASSWNLTPMMGNAGVALAALRNYAHGLHEFLAPEGIYVGHVCVDLLILPNAGEVGDDAIMAHPNAVAAYHWQLYEDRGRFEVKIGNFSGNPIPLEELAALMGQPLSD